MEAYQERMVNEYKELCDRIVKLPKEWSDGCILTSNLFRDTFGVFRQTCEDNPERFEGYVFISSDGIEGYKRPLKMSYSIATPREIDEFYELLHKQGKDWDAKKKQVVDWKWEPKKGDSYFYINHYVKVVVTTWMRDYNDQSHYNAGNCFRTREEAETMAVKVKKLLKGE